MSYDIDIELKENYLFATVCGERTGENIATLAKEILDVCKKNNIDLVFVDLRKFTGRLNITDSYLVVARILPTIKLFQQLKKVAVLELEERYERSRFFEGVAQDNGYNIRMFEDQDVAAAWLLESVKQESPTPAK
jgi:hypothetical protein